MAFDLGSILKDGVGGLFNGVATIVKTFKADPLEVMRLEVAIQQAEQQITLALAQAQTKINEIEAASDNLFVSGWRPAVGWVGVTGLAYDNLLRPLLQSLVNLWYPSYTMVSLDTNELATLLFGILGLGAYRTYEKSKPSIPVV